MVLVGGASRTPHLRELLKAMFSGRVHHDIDPDVTVRENRGHSKGESQVVQRYDTLTSDVTESLLWTHNLRC